LKLKIDENLPGECAEILRDGGFEADTVADKRLTGAEDSAIAVRSRAEGRVRITLDVDSANIRADPPAEYAGIISSTVEEAGQTRRPRCRA
jgi:predicted nuclease of predicted toxin-antitoxin system